MEIPLTPKEVEKVVYLSAVLNKVRNNGFSSLASLTGDGKIRDPRSQLAGLSVSCDTLMDIRRAVQKDPRLTQEHIEDILALKVTLPDELSQLGQDRLAQAVEALNGGVVDEDEIEGIRHNGVSRANQLTRRFNSFFEMVATKAGLGNDPDERAL